MDEKKILIVNLSKGLVGENNANLLGSMLVTKIYLAAMSRADASESELKKLPNFYLYVDEFQSFANKSFADILSEARKYKLSLNITHQYIEQMAEEVRAAVFGNVGTMVTFRVGSFDAEILEKEFAPVFTMEDIVNLGKTQIYLRLMIDAVASQPFSATTLPPIPKPEISFRNKVMENSRNTYANPKAEVEKVIREWHEPETSPEPKAETKSRANFSDFQPKRNSQISSSQGASERRSLSNSGQDLPKQRLEKPLFNNNHAAPKLNVRIKSEKETVEMSVNEPKNSTLANAIAEAMKNRESPKSEAVKTKEEAGPEKRLDEMKEKIKEETVSLQTLKHGDKNKNKDATPENLNALRAALEKAKISESKVEDRPASKIYEIKKEELKTNAKIEIPKEEPKKEESKKETPLQPKQIPEETLRKILKGE